MATLEKDNGTQSYIKDNFSYFPEADGGTRAEGKEEKKETATGEGTQATASTDGPVAGTPTGIDYRRYDKGIQEQTEAIRERQAALKPLEAKKDIYQQMMDSMRRPESAEEKAKREKKEKSRRVIGAVSDGLRALGNLFFTSQYTPDMYQGSTKQLDKANEWIERARAEREKNDEAYYNLALKIGDADAEMAKTVRDLEAQAEARRLARAEAERKARELAMKEEEHPFRLRGAEADANKKESDAEYSRVKAKNAPEYFENQNELGRQKIKTEETRQKCNLASAYEHTEKGNKTKAGNNKPKPTLKLEDGVHEYNTTEDYNRAVQREARRLGIPIYKEEVLEVNVNGKPKKTRTVARKTEDIAGEVELRIENERKEEKSASQPGTMPGVKTNDNNKMPGVN